MLATGLKVEVEVMVAVVVVAAGAEDGQVSATPAGLTCASETR